MKVEQQLASLNISNPTQEIWEFMQNAEFIDNTLDVLSSDNLAQKKSYFIDNQQEITESIDGLKRLIDSIPDEEAGSNLFKLASITIKRLEDGIEKFNQELQMSVHSVKEDIIVSEDTIKDAMQNNETTKQIVEDLKKQKIEHKIDANTEKIRESFNKFSMDKQQFQLNQKPIVKQAVGYLIATQDFSDFRVVPGSNLSKEVLNRMIEKSGIDNARVFQLTELPTKQKTVQKVVTVMS